MKVLDLFSGIGGFSLGLERAGMETVAFCEFEPHARAILKKHWPDIPIHNDVRTLDGKQYRGTIDVVCGGFPCQPFSKATHGISTATDLWPEMLRIINESRPKFVIGENVDYRALRTCKNQLGELGFSGEVYPISARDCGAPHLRERYWYVGSYSNLHSKLHCAINAEASKLPKLCQGIWSRENYTRAFRVPDGIPCRLDRLRRLGNAVIPQIPEAIARAIMAVEKTHE